MNDTIEMSPSEASATARGLAESLAATAKIPFSEAWSRIRNSRPDLFGLLVNRAGPADSITAQVFNRAQEQAARLGPQSIGRRDTRTCTERFHGAQSHEESDAPIVVNRESAPFELHDLVADYRREHNLPSFSVAWERLRLARPELFFATA
jgi:hypothetical protein